MFTQNNQWERSGQPLVSPWFSEKSLKFSQWDCYGVDTEFPCLTRNDRAEAASPSFASHGRRRRCLPSSLTLSSLDLGRSGMGTLAHLCPISTEARVGSQEPLWGSRYMVLWQLAASVNIDCRAPFPDQLVFQLVPSYLVAHYVQRHDRLWFALNHKTYQRLYPKWVHSGIKLAMINTVWSNSRTGQAVRVAHKTRLCGREWGSREMPETFRWPRLPGSTCSQVYFQAHKVYFVD